jgi:hypothetical protein
MSGEKIGDYGEFDRILGDKVDLSRRQFMKAGALAMGALTLAACGVRHEEETSPSAQEGQTPTPPIILETPSGKPDPFFGESLKGGEIVSGRELAGLYKQKLEKDEVPHLDPTIVRSTYYHAMVYFELSSATARERANMVTVDGPDREACKEYMCSYYHAGNFILTITDAEYDRENIPWGWTKIMGATAHESFHNSVVGVTPSASEDFGPLGVVEVAKDMQGFRAAEEKSTGIALSLLKRDGGHYFWHPPEEFAAEYGRFRFVREFIGKGLRGTEIQDYSKRYEVWPEINRTINDLTHSQSDWPRFWGEAISFRNINKHHRNNQRHGFFESVGNRIVELNSMVSEEQLTREETAALGLVAFTDFTDSRLSNMQVLTKLVNLRISAELIVEEAERLSSKLDEVSVEIKSIATASADLSKPSKTPRVA